MLGGSGIEDSSVMLSTISSMVIGKESVLEGGMENDIEGLGEYSNNLLTLCLLSLIAVDIISGGGGGGILGAGIFCNVNLS